MALTATIQPTSLSPEGRCATRAMDGAPCLQGRGWPIVVSIAYS